MSQASSQVKNTLLGKAPLANVALCLGTLERSLNRPRHLPGITVFYGPSGYGKSTAAAIARVRHNAYYVQARSSWTRKAAHAAILKEMGLIPAKTLADMADQVAEQLVLSKRPLIVDEANYLVERGSVEIIRDIYEASLAPIMLIGEEGLPSMLKRWERFHGRVLDWAPAQPASPEDALALRNLYATRVNIADDLMGYVHQLAEGSVRRICVNIERIQDAALAEGRDAMTLTDWGKRDLYTGNAPARV